MPENSNKNQSTENDGQTRATADAGAAAKPGIGETGAGKAEQQASKNAYDEADRAEKAQLPKVNFATFIFSLNSSALVNLGMLEDPAGGQAARNLALAKQTIDILGMLEEKTRGNLSADEDMMLKNILYDLRILYVKELG